MHSTAKAAPARSQPTLYGAEGIRGFWPADLHPNFARSLGQALGHWVRAQGETAVMVGRDMRLSSVQLSAALQSGVREAGVKVYDAGICSGPVLYFGARLLECPVTVRVGAAHDLAERNGVEIAHDGSLLDVAQWTAVRERMSHPAPNAPTPAGAYAPVALQACYIARLLCDIPSLAGLRVVIDAGNGTAGLTAPALFRALGCEVTELFCDPDETFPQHLPDPTDPRNLQDLTYCLRYANADIGLAFDTDARRVVAVTPSGQIIGVDQQLVLFARDLLKDNAGARILSDTQNSRRVTAAVEDAGGQSIAAAGGRAGMRERMQAVGAAIAGDAAGHVCFTDRWFGAPDGLYTAARLLEIASRTNDTAAVLEALPRAYATPELQADTGASDPLNVLQSLASQGQFTGSSQAVDATGLRVEYADGVGVARSADSLAGLVFRFEADTPQALVRIQSTFRRQLRRVAPRVQVPF